MAVESAADRAVFVDPDDFGEAITWTVGATPSTLNVLAAAGTLQLEGIENPGVLDSRAAFVCREADVPAGAGHGDAVTFRTVAHTVKAIEPDGTGMTLVRLERTVSD